MLLKILQSRRRRRPGASVRSETAATTRCRANTVGQCCNGYCVPSLFGPLVCSYGNCLPDAQACNENSNCCSQNCQGGVCLPSCSGGLGAPCTGMIECCEGICGYPSGDPTGTCCGPSGQPCEEEYECCPGLTCARTPQMMNEKGVCVQAGGCEDVGAMCDAHDVCCSGRCSFYQQPGCCPVDEPCPVGFHVCEPDWPTPPKPECASSADNGGVHQQIPRFGPPGCLDTICSDPMTEHCCCTHWDTACRDAVEAQCMVTCSVGLPGG